MRAKLGQALIGLGIFCIAAAVLLTAYSAYSGIRAGQKADQLVSELSQRISVQEESLPDYVLHPDMEMPTIEIDGQACIGILEIPSIEMKLPVISEWSYAALNEAPCRYAGSAYKDNLIIAGHNNRAHFGSLKTLNAGDQVLFVDADGNLFSYKVVMTEILTPSDVDEMKNGLWDLTLFTCDSSLSNRVTIRCERTY